MLFTFAFSKVYNTFMQEFNPSVLGNLYKPAPDSHKGQNGKLLLIGGSRLFHAASLWPLTVASRICDMVFYASVPENNSLVMRAKEEFRNGIVIPRSKIDEYIQEADCVLIGPGLPRDNGEEVGDDDTKYLTERLLVKYPEKRWVIDGGSLQTINPEILLLLKTTPILTPHHGEFEMLKKNADSSLVNEFGNMELEDQVQPFADKYRCVVVLKGKEDFIAGPEETCRVRGGNSGMTKGGTGDVLAGLIASLYCKNEAFLSASAGSYINKKAGESLEKSMGVYFNATDLAHEIPKVMKDLL